MAPEVQFSEDQQAAWQIIAGRLQSRGVDLETGETTEAPEGSSEVLALLGRAGSGKSTLLAALVKALTDAGLEPVSADYESRKKKGRTFAVLAPTNKAASVLRSKGAPATTIHRILYTPVYDEAYEAVAEWLTKPGQPRPELEGFGEEALDRARAFYENQASVPAALAAIGLRGSDFIQGWTRREDPLDIGIIDEASMLDDRQLDDLKEIFGVLLLFGDPAQLAPVGQSGEMAFDSLADGRKLTLSRIHRQAADSPILDLAHMLSQPDLAFEDFEKAVEEAADRDDRVVIAARADADMMARAPILVWRNQTRIRLISAFRTAFELPSDDLAPGEPLICDGIELPRKHRKARIDLEARGLIKGAHTIYLGAGRKAGFARLHVVGAENPRVSAAAIIQIETPDREEPFIPSAARMGAAFLHGAASTIHKAQGSQWRNVQLFAPDIYAAARSQRVEAGIPLWRRLAYVAVTRAEEKLFWVTRYRISRPSAALSIDDLGPAEEPPK